MRFGIHARPQQCSIGELQAVWQHAEKLGFEWISVWDHFMAAPGPSGVGSWEAVSIHAALCLWTSRVRTACLVYSAGYRHPAILANAGVTLDHLGNGRLELGMGAGWHRSEYEAYGIPFEPPAVRLRRLAETVEVVQLLWSAEEVDYTGEFYVLRGARCDPKPVQRELPRIWVGASGEKLALQLVGRHADGWNAPYCSPADFARKLEIVRASSPNPDRLAVAVNVGLVMTADASLDEKARARYGKGEERIRESILSGSAPQVIDMVGEYAERGAQWMILALSAPFDLDELDAFANDVMPHFT